MYKNTPIQEAFKPTNIISHAKESEKCGVYKLTCLSSGEAYIGQTGRSLNTRNKEHRRYIKYSDPNSAYTLHNLNKKQEY
jgi:hypothetical protein